jgi:ubiquinone/menaquinone biosynthesis C-methylase UbiE
MEKEMIEKILNETETGYNLISEKFSQTRNHFWGELEFIKNFVFQDFRVLDFGCGNGRLEEVLAGKNITYIGVDISENLINLAKRDRLAQNGFKNKKFLKIDNDFKHLPFNANFFDTVYSIAVFHHIPGDTNRLLVAKELYRLLKPGGCMIITVWNLWQPRYRKKIIENWWKKIFGKNRLEINDCYIPFTDNRGKKFNRYHHAFTKGSLKNLFKKSGFGVLNCDIMGGNIVLIVQK